MTAVVVLGLQWGDEGKGKIVDFLAKHAEIVTRFQGGNNAGHTIVQGSNIYKLSLLPSGIIDPDKLCLIAGGVVINPQALIEEISNLTKQGISVTPKNLGIAETATVILPWHIDIDVARETGMSDDIGTTQRGIGPAYEDAVGRRAIRICDLRNFDILADKLVRAAAHHNALRAQAGLGNVDINATLEFLRGYAEQIIKFAVHVPQYLRAAHAKNLAIMYEGAQGAMLDISHGTYPFVTSSNTVAAQAAVSCGVPAGSFDHVVGVVKAYSTRVGNGPFPTEISGHTAEFIGDKGAEFGTVTQRKRRIGWFDAVQVRETVAANGVSLLALTKIDVLDGLSEIGICTGYTLRGERIDFVPSRPEDFDELEPVMEFMPGWGESSSREATQRSNLAPNAQRFIDRIEALVGARVGIVSNSPDRDQTLMEINPFGYNATNAANDMTS